MTTKSSKLWSPQLWSQIKQLRIEAWKSHDFNGVWTRYLAKPMRRSNQLSYEATDVGSWSFVSSNEPVKNGCEGIYEVNVSYIELRVWNFKPAVQYMKPFIYPFTSILHGFIRTHKWPAPNVSGFITQLVRASHWYREVTGSNPVEVLTFSGFYTQFLKLRS